MTTFLGKLETTMFRINSPFHLLEAFSFQLQQITKGPQTSLHIAPQKLYMCSLHKNRHVGDFEEGNGHERSFSAFFNPSKLGTCTCF